MKVATLKKREGVTLALCLVLKSLKDIKILKKINMGKGMQTRLNES